MFGMGFTEIMLIAVIAVLFLGPDKLPSAMVDIAKFFRSVKNTIGTVKDSLEEELNVSDIKKEALAYKKELLNASESLSKATDVKSGLASLNDDILGDDDEKPKIPKVAKKSEEVTFAKKQKDNAQKEEDLNV